MESEAGLRRLKGLPLSATVALAAVAFLWALLETFGPRGFSFRDESVNIANAQRFFEGGLWNPAWGRGTLTRWLQYHLMRFGPWQIVHAPILAMLALQCVALGSLARRLGGLRAAQGTVLACLLSAVFLTQARSFLPFAVLPSILALGMLGALRGGLWAAS